MDHQRTVALRNARIGSLVVLVAMIGCNGRYPVHERQYGGPTSGATSERWVCAMEPMDAIAGEDAQPQTSTPPRADDEPGQDKAPVSSLSELLLGTTAAPTTPPTDPAAPFQPRFVDALRIPDEGTLANAGLRLVKGDHIQIITDLPASDAVQKLAEVFDRAVPHWADYFSVRREDWADWQINGCVMGDADRFRAAGFLPDGLPPFRHGLHVGDWIWVREPPTDYFRQHLVLHEGVHAFMREFLGGTGPPWYREGMAEYLATHHFRDGPLRVGEIPRHARDVPGWGRIEYVRRGFQDGNAMMIRDIMEYHDDAFLEDGPYAWCWAAVAFLDGHPSYQRRFRALRRNARDETVTFSRMFEVDLADDLRELDEQWQIFIARCEYPYDLVRNVVTYAAGKELPPEGRTVSIDSAKGWQSTGIRLHQGNTYEITATGKFQIAMEREPWTSEANGVTLRYHRGFPLGLLMGNIRTDQPRTGLANLASPMPVGAVGRIEPVADGTLYLLVHDHPGELHDNHGTVTVHVRQLP